MDEKGIKLYTFDVYDNRLEFVERKDKDKDNGGSSGNSDLSAGQNEEYIPNDDLPFN